MGRKKRGGKSGMHVVQTSAARKPRAQEKFARYLDTEGKRDQIFGRMKECVAPIYARPSHSVYHPSTGTSSRFTLARCWEIGQYHPGGFDGPVTYPLYHGTNEYAIPHITLNGFKLPRRSGMFGRGVYLTPNIDKAFNYTSRSNPLIFMCAAYLGDVRVMDEANHELGPGCGFDTAHGKAQHTKSWAGTLRWNEYALFDPSRIHLRYLLEYERVKAT